MKSNFLIILGLIVLLQCKTNTSERVIDTKTVIHGINDQVISGDFFAVNELGIQHNILIIKNENSTNYPIEISAKNKEGKSLYTLKSKGVYNGYAMIFPLNIKGKTLNILFNFNENQLQVSNENNETKVLEDYYTNGNYLPKQFVHMDQVSKQKSRANNFDFLKNLKGKNALEANVLATPVFISRIIKLMKTDAPLFFENAKFSNEISSENGTLFCFQFCNTENCDQISYKIRIDLAKNHLTIHSTNIQKTNVYSE